MKLMFYINTISFGGAERVIVNLANQFYNNGYDVVFVTTSHMENEYKLEHGVKREVILDKRNYSFFKKNLICIKKLRKLIKVEKPDVIVSFMAEPNFRAIVSCLGTKTKNLISVRNDPQREYPNFLYRFLSKILYRHADCIVFQTEDARKWFPNNIKEKSTIIYNQVSDKFYISSSSIERSGIVTVGRLVEQKNHELLIKAFAKISDVINDNLIIYGDGHLKEYLGKLVSELNIADRVIFRGVVLDVPNFIKNAKLFVLSSDYEGMPNALMEAMAIGLPCISTDCPCGGPRELFNRQNCGVLVSVGDVNELATKMLELLVDDSKRAMLAKNASIAAEAFSPSLIFSRWEKCIKDISLK